ncbi:MAG: bifunctional DNA primase/polymerase [Steroidobacteraceae bacterium]|jgi:hypothetical protein
MSGWFQINFFNDFAESLVDHGFTVTPTKGKNALLKNWQNPKPTDRQWLGRMLNANRFSGCNIGIVCGRVVAIDVDADDPAEVVKIEALLASIAGVTPFQRVGRAPRTLHLYRPAQNEIIPSTDFANIQVLSGGRQFVAFGTHPDTGKVYQWIGPSPATARIDELPTIAVASVKAFAEALCMALGSAQKCIPADGFRTVDAARGTRQRTLERDMLGSVYDTRIVRDANGRVIDGREALMAKITAAEYGNGTHTSPDDLGGRVWARFIGEADLSRPKGSTPKRRWELKDALSKARAICRRKPDLKPPRRSRGGHPASHLHGWRRPGFWTVPQRERHLAEVGRRLTTPATLTVARVMIEAVELASGFCTMPIAEIAKQASCTPRSVTKARAVLRKSGLWIAGPGGVFVPCPVGELNSKQHSENTAKKQVRGNTQIPSLSHLVTSRLVSKASFPSITKTRPYQPDMSDAPVVDIVTKRTYRRWRIPFDVAALARAEMRARGVTQDELAALLSISQPQLANALAGRFGLSADPATRLLAWLRKAA